MLITCQVAEVDEHSDLLLLLHFPRLVDVQLDRLPFLQIFDSLNILLEVGIFRCKLEVVQEIVKVIFYFYSQLIFHRLEDFLFVVGNSVCHFCCSLFVGK